MIPIALTEHRAAIDGIDEALLHLLARRFARVAAVAELKRMHDLPARIPERIDAVRQHAEHLGAELGLPEGAASALWTLLIELSCQAEERAQVRST